MKTQPVKELRDEFAMNALNILLLKDDNGLENRRDICRQAYVIADQMIKTRQ